MRSTRSLTSLAATLVLASLGATRPAHAQGWGAPPPASGAPYAPGTPAPYAPGPGASATPWGAPPPLSAGGLTAPPTAYAPATPAPNGAWPAPAPASASAGHAPKWLYLEPEVGFAWASVGSALVPPAESHAGAGPSVGFGAGLQAVFFSVGPRVRWAHLGAFDLTSLDGEAALRLPLGDLEASVALGGGWAHAAKLASGGASASGWNARLGAGLDWFATDALSFGGRATGDLLHLSRSGVGAGALAADASATGGGVTLSLVVGVHAIDL